MAGPSLLLLRTSEVMEGGDLAGKYLIYAYFQHVGNR
jgi:hypothetical protein